MPVAVSAAAFFAARLRGVRRGGCRGARGLAGRCRALGGGLDRGLAVAGDRDLGRLLGRLLRRLAGRLLGRGVACGRGVCSGRRVARGVVPAAAVGRRRGGLRRGLARRPLAGRGGCGCGRGGGRRSVAAACGTGRSAAGWAFLAALLRGRALARRRARCRWGLWWLVVSVLSDSSICSVHSVRPPGAPAACAERDRTEAVVASAALRAYPQSLLRVAVVRAPVGSSCRTWSYGVVVACARSAASGSPTPSAPRAGPAPGAPLRAVLQGQDRRPNAMQPRRRRVVRRGSPAARPGRLSHVARPGRSGPRRRRPSAAPGRGHPRPAGRSWSAARPRPRRGPGTPSTAARTTSGGSPGNSMRQAAASIRSGSDPGPATTASTMSRPSGSTASRAARSHSGSIGAGQADLEVLGLAAGTGRRRPDVADLRVRGEPGRVAHRDLGAAQRPLERAGEVAVRGEAQPAALGVADAHPLHHRRRRRPLGNPPGHQPAPTRLVATPA